MYRNPPGTFRIDPFLYLFLELGTRNQSLAHMTQTSAYGRAASFAVPAKPLPLNLERGPGYVFRLMSTSDYTEAPRERFVGRRVAWHWTRYPFPGRRYWYWCGGAHCVSCAQGRRRYVRDEVCVLLEVPDGPYARLEARRGYLTAAAARQLAPIAASIEAGRRDPTEVRILWKYRDASSRVQEISELPSGEAK